MRRPEMTGSRAAFFAALESAPAGGITPAALAEESGAEPDLGSLRADRARRAGRGHPDERVRALLETARPGQGVPCS